MVLLMTVEDTPDAYTWGVACEMRRLDQVKVDPT